MPLSRFQPRAFAILVAFAAAPAIASAQSAPAAGATLPGRCAGMTIAPAHTVTDAARIEAQQIAGRAQAASIQGDNAAATALYRKAAALDPTDPGIAYALGRGYEAAGDTRAMREYCHFLAIAPSAPEAVDVRQRIAELSLALPPDTAIVRVPVTAPERLPAPGAVLVEGLIIPGLGQFATHHPAAGLLVMALTGGAAAYAFQAQPVTSQVTHTALDPLGHSYTYQTTETHTEHPHAAVGLAAAATVSVMAALDAFTRTRDARNNKAASAAATNGAHSSYSLSPIVAFGTSSMGFGLALR